MRFYVDFEFWGLSIMATGPHQWCEGGVFDSLSRTTGIKLEPPRQFTWVSPREDV